MLKRSICSIVYSSKVRENIRQTSFVRNVHNFLNITNISEIYHLCTMFEVAKVNCIRWIFRIQKRNVSAVGEESNKRRVLALVLWIQAYTAI